MSTASEANEQIFCDKNILNYKDVIIRFITMQIHYLNFLYSFQIYFHEIKKNNPHKNLNKFQILTSYIV